ncbi:anti-anti-sigma factor [Pedobacter yulinensis]|uniref:Anti-sigma factor antagonist n=1 Tax=Pedobacter yulinensis TaxID=2126353 RepID=A0A2T3HLN0_9SPHI|nr:STAS domain-containing protein [Pedobacter yulinensis]PST83368.1 anti-anti-sigma factor [Pedobacter yulinensis]
MNLKKEKINDVLLITIEEREANLSKAESFKDKVLQDIQSGETQLVISFKNVTYLDSSFLGALVAILKNLLPLKGQLTLTELNEDIQNLFELTRLDKVFVIKDSPETATS